jgi:hypothetical protein
MITMNLYYDEINEVLGRDQSTDETLEALQPSALVRNFGAPLGEFIFALALRSYSDIPESQQARFDTATGAIRAAHLLGKCSEEAAHVTIAGIYALCEIAHAKSEQVRLEHVKMLAKLPNVDFLDLASSVRAKFATYQ